jgi:cytochrome b6-f complex iron-sulfur subunit
MTARDAAAGRTEESDHRADPTGSPDRRTMLAGVGAGVLGLVAVSACSANRTDAADGPLTGASGPVGPATDPTTAADTTQPPATRAPATKAPAPAAQVVTAVSNLTQGQTTAAKDPSGRNLLVTMTGPNSVVAYDATCTHMGCQVPPSGACPCHGSRFTPATGAVVNGPATSPLQKVAVAVQNGQVVLAG